MADHYEKTEIIGFGERLGRSFKSVLFGLVLFVASFALLFWNEGRAVKTAMTLDEGAAAVVDAPADKVVAGNDGKLLHISGLATTAQTLTDPVLNVSAKALRLQREVEMFQWTQRSETTTQKQLGGSEKKVTTYHYQKEWKSELVNSARFDSPADHANPASMPYQSSTITAGKVTVGAYTLPAQLVSEIANAKRLAITQTQLARFAPEAGGAFIKDGIIYIPRGLRTATAPSVTEPQLGDIRITMKAVEPQDVSVIARQSGQTFVPFSAKTGKSIFMLSPGLLSSQQMFASAASSNTTTTWVLRLVGFLMMFFGIMAFFSPLATLADVIPLLGGFIRMGAGIIAFVPALALSLITIAVAWLWYRPGMGAGLLIAGGILIGMGLMLKKKNRPAA